MRRRRARMSACAPTRTPSSTPDFLAFAHRGGALLPAEPASGEQPARLRRGRRPRLPLSRDRRPRDRRRGADRLPRRRARPGHRRRRPDRRPAVRGRPAGPGSAATTPSRRWRELFEAFPDARFNIDAKSDRRRSRCWPATIAEHDAYDRVCVSSFGIRRLHRAPPPARAPDGVARPRRSGIAVNRFVPWLTAVLDTPAPALQLPVDRRVFGRELRGADRRADRARCTAPASTCTSGPSTTRRRWSG